MILLAPVNRPCYDPTSQKCYEATHRVCTELFLKMQPYVIAGLIILAIIFIIVIHFMIKELTKGSE